MYSIMFGNSTNYLRVAAQFTFYEHAHTYILHINMSYNRLRINVCKFNT